MLKKSLLFLVILVISLSIARPLGHVYAYVDTSSYQQEFIENFESQIDTNPILFYRTLPQIEYDEKNLTKISHVNKDILNSVLIKNLSNQANLFLQAEKESNINVFFLVALAAVESGWGEKPNYKNNLFGWTGGERYYNSLDSIVELSNKIKDLYLTPSGKYFNGYSLRDVNVHYNGKEEWYSRVNSVATDLYLQCLDRSEKQWYNIIIEENKENNVTYGELFKRTHSYSLLQYTNA